MVAGLAAMPSTAGAGIITLQASGLFADRAALDGTYTVNTTTGVSTSVYMTFGPPVSSDVTFLDVASFVGCAGGPIMEPFSWTALAHRSTLPRAPLAVGPSTRLPGIARRRAYWLRIAAVSTARQTLTPTPA